MSHQVPSQSVELASFPGAPTFDFEARRHDDSLWNRSWQVAVARPQVILASGYVNIAMENGPFIVDFPMKNGDVQ